MRADGFVVALEEPDFEAVFERGRQRPKNYHRCTMIDISRLAPRGIFKGRDHAFDANQGCVVCSPARPHAGGCRPEPAGGDRKSTRLNSSHVAISYAVFCLKKKT